MDNDIPLDFTYPLPVGFRAWLSVEGGWSVPVVILASKLAYGCQRYQVRQDVDGPANTAWVAGERVRARR